MHQASPTLKSNSAPTDAASGQPRAVAVGQQLYAAFRDLIDAFPSQARTVSQMSRWLKVMRPNCQRIALGMRCAAEPMELLQRFPGVRGLSQFVSAAAARGVDPAVIESAERAVTAYADLIGEFGGTQSRLTARLTGKAAAPVSPPPDHDGIESRRRQGFEFASATTGYRCTTRTEVAIVRVMPSDPSSLEIAVASGLIGAVRGPHGMPLCRMHRTLRDTRQPGEVTTLEGRGALGFTPRAQIPGFSTPNIPSVSRPLDDGWIIEVFNEEGSDRPVDIVIGNHHAPATDHPATTSVKIYNRGVLVAVPAERLLIDVYMERALAQASIVSGGVYFTGMLGGIGPNRPESRWFDRLPDEPPIEHLGAGLRRSGSTGYARQAELTAHLFESLGWSPERFIGFRSDNAYPIWGAEYVLTFDFGPEDESSPASRDS